MNISQSIIKAYEEYQDGTLCGIVFKAKYIDKTFPDITSAAMRLGHYFEYLVTGQLPRDGKEPKPKWMKSAPKAESKRKTEHMMAEYRLAVINAERTKGYLSKTGMIVESTGVSVANDGITGILDIYGDLGGNKVIIDLKYSGLLGKAGRFDAMGWGALGTDMYMASIQEKHHGTQAIHYSILFGVDEFYYLVVSSTNEVDVELFNYRITEQRKQDHMIRINNVREGIEMGKIVGFKAHPSVSRCASCPWLKGVDKNGKPFKCRSAREYPDIKYI